VSSALANRRLTDAAMSVADFRGRRVIDVGCGDGTYTTELVTRAGATEVTGVDPAGNAIRAAQARSNGLPVTFAEASAYALPYDADSFELAQLRGVLHHVERPRDALEEALRVAPRVVVIEPNGYNLGLKVLERFSRYHRSLGRRTRGARREPHVRRLRADVLPRWDRPRDEALRTRCGGRAPPASRGVRGVRLRCRARVGAAVVGRGHRPPTRPTRPSRTEVAPALRSAALPGVPARLAAAPTRRRCGAPGAGRGARRRHRLRGRPLSARQLGRARRHQRLRRHPGPPWRSVRPRLLWG